LLVCAPSFFSKPVLALNRIEGLVYDPNRVPINDVYSVLRSTKTIFGGRFSFIGVSSGRFIIKVLPLGQKFLGETKEIEIVNTARFSSDIAYVDIYLRYDKRNNGIARKKAPEAIFIQIFRVMQKSFTKQAEKI
jgi:hypothetical protein